MWENYDDDDDMELYEIECLREEAMYDERNHGDRIPEVWEDIEI
jgi:hypothetical protein